MNPGPEPKEAIREAIKNALARGTGLDRDLLLEARFQFILFCAGLTVFVLVRRTRVRITSPEDCAAEYRRDILRLRRVPLNGVVARELWLLSSWGTWQYFRILDDRVIEIRADGTPMVTERAACTKGPAMALVADPVVVPVPDSGLASEPAHVPAPEPDPALASVPARVSLPELSPVGSSSSSDEGGE